MYSEGKITDRVIDRYRALSEQVVIISRLRPVEETADLVPLLASNLGMVPVRGTSFARIFSLGLLANLGLMWREIGAARTVVLRLPSMLSVLATPILVLKRIPYVVEVVGLPRDGLAGKGNGLVPRLLGWILHNLTQMLVSRSIGTIYVTQHALQEVFPTRGISAAASNVELALSPVDPSTRTELPLHSPVRIGTIGSLATTYKGFDIAIRSIASLRAAGHDCRLQVLGSGDPMSYLALARELGCADAIRFDGIRKGGVAVAEWLDTLDIYIQPSRTEGLPRALIEAMARGLPAVASDVGGIAELLEPRWLVRPGEVTPLMDCLRNLIENDEVRIVAGLKNARRAVDYSTRVLQARRTEFFEAVSKAIEVSKDPTQSKRNRRFQ